MNTVKENKTVKISILTKRPAFRLRKQEIDHLKLILLQTLTYRMLISDCFSNKAQIFCQNNQYQKSYVNYLFALSVFKKSDLIGTPVDLQSLANSVKQQNIKNSKDILNSSNNHPLKKKNFLKNQKISFDYIDNPTIYKEKNSDMGSTETKLKNLNEPESDQTKRIQRKSINDLELNIQWECYSGSEIKIKVSSILNKMASVLWKLKDLNKLKDVCKEGILLNPDEERYYHLNGKLFKILSTKTKVIKNLKLSLKNFRKYKLILETRNKQMKMKKLFKNINALRKTYLKSILVKSMLLKLKIAENEQIHLNDVVLFFGKLFNKVFNLIEKFYFLLTTSDKKIYRQQFYIRLKYIQRYLEDFLIFFRDQLILKTIEEDMYKSKIIVSEEDYQKLHLVLLFFMTIKKEKRKKMPLKRKSKHRKAKSIILYKKVQKYFLEKMITVSRRETCSTMTTSDQEIEHSKQSTLSNIGIDYNKVVQSAYYTKNPTSLFDEQPEVSSHKYNVSKELSKSAAEIKKGIHQESHKHNKLYLSLTRKLIKVNSKNKSKSILMKKELKLKKNLQFMKDRQELKILENSWKTHTKYQQNCKNYYLGEIMKVTEAKSQVKCQSDFILRAMNAFIMIFVCFFIFVSISVIYLIRINRF